jgi:hypothetical protein
MAKQRMGGGNHRHHKNWPRKDHPGRCAQSWLMRTQRQSKFVSVKEARRRSEDHTNRPITHCPGPCSNSAHKHSTRCKENNLKGSKGQYRCNEPVKDKDTVQEKQSCVWGMKKGTNK